MKKTETLELFRYQLLPVRASGQLPLPNENSPKTADEARQRKNEFFEKALKNIESLRHLGKPLRRKNLIDEGDIVAFRLGAQKRVKRINQELLTEDIESWPNVVVAINNDPSVQMIAVSRDRKAFSSPSIVTNILNKALNEFLMHHGLSAHIEAMFEKNEFWQLARKFENRVEAVRFELVSPNMANISKGLKIDLRGLNRATNNHTTDLEIASAPDGALKLEEDNEVVASLVEYAAEGGGDVSLKIKGFKKRIRTSKGARTIEVAELDLKADRLFIAETLRKVLQ